LDNDTVDRVALESSDDEGRRCLEPGLSRVIQVTGDR
jgi:hypothetical protein